MSTLKKSLLALDAEETAASHSHPCYSTDQHVSALAVESSCGRRWVLPWQHFLNAQHDDDGKTETLLLCFATHEVIVRGRKLAPLEDAVAKLRLEALREAPKKYTRSTDADPFVAEIQVRAVAQRSGDGANGGMTKRECQ